MNKLPPKYPLRFFRWFCHPDYVEDIEGDLLERFEKNPSRWRFSWEVVKLLRPGIIKNFEGTQKLNYYGMLQNHIKTALRVFRREKMFTAINILGLTVSMWCTIMIALWVFDESSFDNFHADGDRIYRIYRNMESENGDIGSGTDTAYPIAETLKEDFPEITDRVRYARPDNMILSFNEDFVPSYVAATDSNFFQFFSLPLLSGDPKTCLLDMKSIVISERFAAEHFDGKEALGETVTINEGAYTIQFQVTGVFKKLPQNSSMQFDAIIPVYNYLQFHAYPNSWGNSWLQSYVKLDENANPKAVSEKIKNVPKDLDKADWFTLAIQPFEDQYLYSSFENGLPSGGRIDNVILFTLIAAFTLLIACFNFINLTTAKVSRRAMSIGIRKVIGARRATLIGQFLTESTIMTLVSIVLALIISQLSLPAFNALTGKSIAIDYFDLSIYQLMGVLIVITLICSSIYPAIFLSSLHPLRVLKKAMKRGMSQAVLRKVLVTIQFSLTLILIAGTLTILFQMSYIRKKDLGLDKENVLVVQTDFKTGPDYKNLRSELLSHSSIVSVGAANGNFKDNPGSSSDPIWRNKSNAPENKKWFAILTVDYNLPEVLSMEMVEGRIFSEEFASDTTHFLINEQAAQTMGFTNAVGEDLEVWGVKGKIIGVVKDFNFESLHSSIMPIIFRYEPNYAYRIYVKTAPGKTLEAIEHLEKVHAQFSSLPLSFQFMDQTLDEGYRREMLVQQLAKYFSSLAIFISFLGLFGLASYTAEQRTKEIAIRRVLGARLVHLLNLLFKEYALLILIAFAVGFPISYWWINSWLSGFAYRMDINAWLFILPLGLILSIGLLTIIRISIAALRNNPADSLQNE